VSQSVYQPSDLPSRMAGEIEADPESGCWLWTGSCNRDGPSRYGTVSYQRKTQLVHRVVFKLLVGEIPKGFQVSHAEPRGSHHTRCCNPHHLEAVTREEALRRRKGMRPQNPVSTRLRVPAGEHVPGPPRGSGSAKPAVARRT
jgi:hypothetical protein